MKNFKEKATKSSNGITLIALVITIIVLLILAGISISMLSGDNSILQKATDSKEQTDMKTLIENAKIDVLSEIIENNGNAITDVQLKNILAKYFEEFEDELPENLSGTTITLTAKDEYGGYNNIALGDIYKGTLRHEPETVKYGISDDKKVFIGKLTDDTARHCNGNVEFEDGYKFTEGHFLFVENYFPYAEDNGKDIYFVWDDELGTINDWGNLFNIHDLNFDAYYPDGSFCMGCYR